MSEPKYYPNLRVRSLEEIMADREEEIAKLEAAIQILQEHIIREKDNLKRMRTPAYTDHVFLEDFNVKNITHLSRITNPTCRYMVNL